MKYGEARIRVRYKETDQMGVVHHSNYYTWFEIARAEVLRNEGLSYHRMEEMGVMLPVLETHCTYIHGAKYDDMVIVRARLTQFSGVRLTMEYEAIREEDGLLLAKGSTVHAFTDSNLKPIIVKKKYPEIYKLFCELLDTNTDK